MGARTTFGKSSSYGVRTGGHEYIYSPADLEFSELYGRLTNVLLGQVSSDQNFAVRLALALFEKSGNARRRQVCATYAYESIDHDDTSE